MLKHYIEYMYPGAFCSEYSYEEVAKREDRPHGGSKDIVEIEIREEAESSKRLLLVQIELDVFSKTLLGLGRSPCEFELYGLASQG